jgi:D-3-phosphoglycerate dehydrogenase
MHFHGDFQGKALDPLKIGFFKGLFSAIMTDDAPNYVSAPLFAKEHGIQVYLDQEEAAKTEDYTHLMEIMTEIGETNYKLMGSVINGISNIISLQEFPIEFRLEGIVLVVQNRDIPNMVGTIGTFIGSKNINIARLELARIKKGTTAFTALSLDTPLSDTEIKELKAKEGILDVFQVNFEG